MSASATTDVVMPLAADILERQHGSFTGRMASGYVDDKGQSTAQDESAGTMLYGHST